MVAHSQKKKYNSTLKASFIRWNVASRTAQWLLHVLWQSLFFESPCKMPTASGHGHACLWKAAITCELVLEPAVPCIPHSIPCLRWFLGPWRNFVLESNKPFGKINLWLLVHKCTGKNRSSSDICRRPPSVAPFRPPSGRAGREIRSLPEQRTKLNVYQKRFVKRTALSWFRPTTFARSTGQNWSNSIVPSSLY
jgi:hypothetical protein